MTCKPLSIVGIRSLDAHARRNWLPEHPQLPVTLPTQALLKQTVLFLEILDHVRLMAVDPSGEYHEQQLKRLKRWEHRSAVYRLTNHRASSNGRLAHSPIASLQFLDTTGAAVPQWTHPANSACAARARQRGRRSKRMTIDRLPAPPERQRAHRVPAMIDRRARTSGFKATARSAAAEPGRRAMLAVALVRRVSAGTRRGHPCSTLC
jgi:hypothetical protein